MMKAIRTSNLPRIIQTISNLPNLSIKTNTILNIPFTRFSSTISSLIKPKKVCLAMSGGVDSSVAAILLKQSDYQIRAVFVKNWTQSDQEEHVKSNCEWRKDWEDVNSICKQLSLNQPQLIDLSKEYWNKVWQPCLEIWENGGTPNADVMCNRYIKFGILAERIFREDPDTLLATGHYARLEYQPNLKLLRALDKRKDQSYYLSTTSPSILKRTLFPLGNYTKSEVRQMALANQLVNARKKESMGICFVEPKTGKGRFDKFLEEHLMDQPGEIITNTGHQLGTHQGLWRYTIGQRCRIPSQPTKMFVSRKDMLKNQLLVVPHHDHPDLYSTIVYCAKFHLIGSTLNVKCGQLSARLRTGTIDPIPCKVTQTSNTGLRVELKTPEHGVAAGQVIVLQHGDEVLGGGSISRVYRDIDDEENHHKCNET